MSETENDCQIAIHNAVYVGLSKIKVMKNGDVKVRLHKPRRERGVMYLHPSPTASEPERVFPGAHLSLYSLV